METKATKRVNRKRPKLYGVDSFYLPIVLLEQIERIAGLEYGGNKSALVTEKLSDALNVDIPKEVTQTA
jgi:hypothetical protein